MASDGKKVWLWVGIAVVALSSCCCVGGIAGFFLVAQDQEADFHGPVAAPAPVPPGWGEYVQRTNCAALNPNLVLSGFRVHHPPSLQPQTCAEQPVPASYVNFLESDAAGRLTGQFGLGYVFGPSVMEHSLLDQLASDFERQMPLGSRFVPHDSAPLFARGTSLTRKDYVVHVAGDFAGFSAGTYAYRFVLVRQPASDQGLLVTMIRTAMTTPEAAFSGMQADYGAMLESIRF